MTLIVTIVGRHNVGKSTLFNCLTHNKNSLVANFPGLTRDRKYGFVGDINGYKFIFVDTGSIEGKKKGIEIHIVEQSLLAIDEADIILFVVDAQTGLMPADFMIAKYLRINKKKICLVVNKTENLDIDQVISDFWSLGLGKIYPIAALYKIGISILLEEVLLPFANKNNKLLNKLNKELEYLIKFNLNKLNKKKISNNITNDQNLPIKLAIVGRQNVGKSTLTNRILGKKRMIVCDIPGTTRDSVYIPIQYNNRDYVIIDTAGICKYSRITKTAEGFSVRKTLIAIKDANVVILVIDARRGISNQDLSLLNFIFSNGCSVVIVINKYDNLSKEEKKQIKNVINHRLCFINFVRIHFISALYDKGSKNIDNIFKSITESYGSVNQHISTAMLTRIMLMAIKKYQPPIIHGYRVKLKYAHIGGRNPLIIVIHGNQVQSLPNYYKQYLANYFRKELNFIGSIVIIRFNNNNNPFINNSNILNLSKSYKHKYFMENINNNKI